MKKIKILKVNGLPKDFDKEKFRKLWNESMGMWKFLGYGKQNRN